MDVCLGVPQGSVLGPLFFNIYTNDLKKLPIQLNIIQYADDTVIFFSDKDPTRINSALNKKFVSLIKWLEENELIINI